MEKLQSENKKMMQSFINSMFDKWKATLASTNEEATDNIALKIVEEPQNDPSVTDIHASSKPVR